MIGAFTAAMDTISAVNKLAEVNSDEVNNAIRQLNNTKSITERAKKALFVYPVLFSPGVSDIKVASKISKFLEIQYGIFTTMTVGLMPSVEDGDISNYLNSIAAEGYDFTDKIKIKTYDVNPTHKDLWYSEFLRSNEDFFEEYEGYKRNEVGTEDYNSTERALTEFETSIHNYDSYINSLSDDMTEDQYSELTRLDQALRNSYNSFNHEYGNLSSADRSRFNRNNRYVSSTYNSYSDVLSDPRNRRKISRYQNNLNQKERQEAEERYNQRLAELEEKKKAFNDLNPLEIGPDDGLSARATTEAYKTIDKLKAANPTMINLRLKIKGYEDDFVIPIGLKANPHFVSQTDLAALFDSAIEDKRLLTRIVKLTSGEISFFKDFLFSMDRAKRDQALYAKFGQHPWYRQFVQRKENNGFKKLGIVLASLVPGLRSVVNQTSNFLPTASIVMTLDEIERSTKMKYGFLLKHEKILWSVLNHLGLLSICIYNPEMETCSFYFNGFKKPMLVALADMKGDKDDANAEMAKVMQLMMKRGIM